MKLEKAYHYITNLSSEEINSYFNKIDAMRLNSTKYHQVLFLDLGTKKIKIENNIPELAKLLEIQFSCSLCDFSEKYDATIYVWQDDISSQISDFAKEAKGLIISSNTKIPQIEIDLENNQLKAFNNKTNQAYFAIKDISTEKVSKWGHLFVNFIYQMAKTEKSTLVHAAAVGINNKGVLIAAKGGKGKSTLAVSCMLDGFQYVADDYLILNKDDQLYASPIYSIITLSPAMQQKMPALSSKFLYDNYNNTKHVLDISHYPTTKKLPIKAVFFPNIVTTEVPTIEPANKGQAITQLIYSTISQMNEKNNPENIKKLISFLDGLEYYQINLSSDLDANVQILRTFINKKGDY
ncbi:hypothetical protein LJC10_03035 [Selenomonadales bacterium OttesenSCG-928-I06]|nr:hypothetical protein [Selenomonadales bacterium OttesenSCG-928-I06]